MFNIFNRQPSRPVLRNDMRCFDYERSTDKLYLYEFGDTKINGYFIREEVTTDLVLRGMPLVARLGITGDLFVDERGAGIRGSFCWNNGDRIHQSANNELSIELDRIQRGAQIRYNGPCKLF